MIFVCKNIKKLKEPWKRLIDSETGKFYLTYEFGEVAFSTVKWYQLVKPSRRVKFICGENEGKIGVIFPLLIDRRDKTIVLLGSMNEAGYNDIICSPDTPDELISEVWEYLRKVYPGFTVRFTDLCADSRLNSFAKAEFFRPCYRLISENGFDGWYALLSTGERNNLRNHYNRMRTDGVDARFSCVEKAGLFLRLRCLILYQKRLREILTAQGHPVNDFKYYLSLPIRYFKTYFGTPFFKSINKLDRAFLMYSVMRGKVVAFDLGYREKDGIIIPRRAFDSKYARYSPGMFNVAELFKLSATPGTRFVYDLSRDVHEYKLSWGGVEYDNNYIETIL